MDTSYPTVYESYVTFCQRIGSYPIQDYETWMKNREDDHQHRDMAKEFLRATETK